MKNIPKKQFAGWMLMLLLCISISAFAQSPKKVTGRVMDAQGELLIGVNVTEAAGPSNGVVTDINGTYTITLKGNKPSLKFSYIGFKDKVVAVGSSFYWRYGHRPYTRDRFHHIWLLSPRNNVTLDVYFLGLGCVDIQCYPAVTQHFD